MNATHSFLFGLALLGLSAAASAQPDLSNVNITACPTVTDAQMTVGKTPQGSYYDSRTSNGTVYSQDCNKKYTVDITVPGSYSLPGTGNAITIRGSFDQAQFSESTCDNASVSLVIYKRTTFFQGTWTNWEIVNSQNVQHGTWVPFVDLGYPPYCALSVPLRVVAPPVSLMTDQYRVMVAPKLFGVPLQARISWQWTY